MSIVQVSSPSTVPVPLAVTDPLSTIASLQVSPVNSGNHGFTCPFDLKVTFPLQLQSTIVVTVSS